MTTSHSETEIAPSIVETPAHAPTLAAIPATWSVYVTLEDLLLGMRCDAWGCAVARAALRWLVLNNVLPPNGDVTVYPDRLSVFIRWSGRSRPPQRMWRHDARDLIFLFDKGLPVEPRRVTFWEER